MTEFDKILVGKADKYVRRYDWRHIDTLVAMADTHEAKERLYEIQSTLYDLLIETI